MTEIDNNKASAVAALAGGAWLLGLIAALFVALRVLGVTAWSWWWVLLPLWGPFALVAVLALGGLVGLIVYAIRKHNASKGAKH